MAASKQPPERPKRLRTRLKGDEETLTGVISGRSWSTAVFMSFWLTIWTAGCIWLLVEAFTKQDWFLFLFGVPFWASWFFATGVLLNALFSETRFTLGPDGFRQQWRVLRSITIQEIPLWELRRFCHRILSFDRENSSRHAIEVQRMGKSLYMGENLSIAEQEWLAFALDDHRQYLQRQAGISVTPDSVEIQQLLADGNAPTHDSAWSLQDDTFADLVFANHGRFELGSVLGLAFLNAFWNGIVSLFVLSMLGLGPEMKIPEGSAWWIAALFLLPFVVIGAMLLFGLVFLVLEPFRETRWIFADGRIRFVSTWLGWSFGLAENYTVGSAMVVIVQEELKPTKGKRTRSTSSEMGPLHQLTIGDESNPQICAITGLTFGEAVWMREELLRKGLAHEPVPSSENSLDDPENE